ncbi:MAG TPA: hypothetical protein PKE66_05965 [Pyrinomonadaceae bacterium]|nr:hypothetical protein [Pyrinomonadaceae bacterium]
MKSCPTCRRTYPDHGLNFCLEDGTPLVTASDEPPATMVMNTPPTNPGGQIPAPPTMQTSWDAKPNYSLQPKKSRAWLWVVGVLGIGLLLCGGGIAGLFVIGIMNEPQGNTVISTDPTPAPTGSPARNDRANVEKLDLSKWVRESSSFGTTEFTGGEFLMAARQRGYYYVLVAPAESTSENARSSVTLRNMNDAPSSLGYGLIFLSNPTPLVKGYAFLIDTKTRRYRVVRHEPSKELPVVNWAKSDLIRPGTAENTLEADHRGDNIDLYINGQKATSIRNVHGYQGGVVGLYSGDGVRIAFKDLEIRR